MLIKSTPKSTCGSCCNECLRVFKTCLPIRVSEKHWIELRLLCFTLNCKFLKLIWSMLLFFWERSSSWASCILALCRRGLRGWNFEIHSFYVIWKRLWNSQNFGYWVFSCSNYPQNGYPNFEAIRRPFIENSPIHFRAYNGRTTDYERSGLSGRLH